MSTKVVTGKVRLSYCNLFTPKAASDNGDAKYSVTILIPKSDTKTMQAIKAALEEVRLNSAHLFGGKVPSSMKNPIHDGDGDKPNGGEYGPECKGCWVVNASSKNPPQVVDRAMNDLSLDQRSIYSGCYGRVSVNFYAYSNSGNKGIACGLNNVQKLADGDPLGGGSTAAADFADDFEDDDFMA